MPIVLGDTSGIGQGIQTAGGALAQALEKRAEGRLTQQRQSVLDKAIQGGDFATEEGQKRFLSEASQAGIPIKDALGVLKQMKPSQLDLFLDRYNANAPTPTLPQDRGNPNVIETGPTPAASHPATQPGNFSNIPEEALVLGSGSDDRQVAEFSKAELDSRDRAHKNFTDERKYQTTQAKKHMERIEDSRSSSRLTNSAINQMKWGVQNRDLSQFSQDWWANQLGAWGKGLVTPEGAIVGQGVKEFMIGDLERIKGRPNQFLEQRLLSLAASVGQEEEANLANLAALGSRQAIQDKEIELTDKLGQQYEDDPNYGYVPGNIGRIVNEQMKPFVEETESKLAYELRSLQESYTGIENLASKKVPPDTPLTLEMMDYFARKYGQDKGREMANKFGYRIPTADEYNRYSK